MESKANPYQHQHYTHVKDEKDADAVAWVFLNKEEFVKFPFKFEELPDDQIRVNVTYTGLCHSDSLAARSLWGPANYPLCPGHEIVGEITKIGRTVKGFEIGDRIGFGPFRDFCETCKYCQKSQENLCDGIPSSQKEIYDEYWGGYSTAVQHPAKMAFKIPEALPSDVTPPILCAGVTTYAPIARYARSGQKTAVIGIGGLGHMAVQYLNKMGCHVTAFSSSLEKTEMIKKLGAREVISSSDPEALEKAAGNYDFVINTLPVMDSALFESYLNLTAGGGTFAMVGLPPVNDKITLSPFPIVTRNINFVGSLVGSRRETIEALNFSALHNIVPMVEFFDFDDFPKALETLEKGRPKFRCVVNVQDWAKKHGFHQK